MRQSLEKKMRQVVATIQSQPAHRLVFVSFAIGLIIGGFMGTATGKQIASRLLDPGATGSSNVPVVESEEEVTEFPRQLDGILVAPEDVQQFPYCVMIENAAFDGVRPQTGLNQAAIVYEIIVEGGITRFMAVFGNKRPEVLGPVRSARENFVEVAAEYNCPYYHAGGSDTALERMIDLKFRSVNGLNEYQYFWRDPLKFGPHDFFTSGDNMKLAAQNHNWWNEAWPDFIEWARLQEQDVAAYTAEASSQPADMVEIGFDFGYEARWDYNAKTGVYTRTTAGEKHIDAATGSVLQTQNIVIQYVGDGTPIPGKGRINWPMIGTGRVEILHNGRVYEGFWRKAHEYSRTLFVDEYGEPLPLAAGNTWVEIVPPHVQVTYQ